MYDTNGDGYICRKELAAYMKDLVAEDVADDSYIKMTSLIILASADEDGDGKLNFEKFTDLIE